MIHTLHTLKNVFKSTKEDISLTAEEKLAIREKIKEAMGLSSPKLAFERQRIAQVE
ncbi:MAG: hypothetical protein V4674_01955 [Patescibacteria group bacterium]